jgi:hypothetical protein
VVGNKTGLVGYWSFDGKDMDWGANRATDLSGQVNHGMLINMSTSSSPVIGISGQAFKFDGVNDRILTINSLPTLQQLSASFYIKTPSVWPSITEPHIIRTVNHSFNIMLNLAAGGNQYKMRFEIDEDGVSGSSKQAWSATMPAARLDSI